MKKDQTHKESAHKEDEQLLIANTLHFFIDKLEHLDKKGVLRRMIESGVDLSTRNAVKAGLSLLGEDTETADKLFTDIRNELNRKAFLSIPYRDRALFLPQCLRNSETCQAKMETQGYVCRHCGACAIARITEVAEGLGYKVYIVPGGSLVLKIVASTKPKAVVGVACDFELGEAHEKLAHAGICGRGVRLKKDGCKNTEVDVDALIALLREIE